MDDNFKNISQNIEFKSYYCDTGEKCIVEYLSNDMYKYINSDHIPVKIEVPSDKYNDALMIMEHRIRAEKIDGVSRAEDIVKKGLYTYEQVKTIALTNKVQAIIYDELSGLITTDKTIGISAVITYALSVWNSLDYTSSLRNLIYSGLKVGEMDFMNSIFSSQINKNNIDIESLELLLKENNLTPSKDNLKENINLGATTIRGLSALSGTFMTNGFSVVILSSLDISNMFKGRISSGQFFKNIANTASSVAGASAGWAAGATIGSVVPVVGTIVGGFVGALLGSKVTHTISDSVLNEFIEDDADKMLKIIESQFIELTQKYILSKEEVNNIINILSEKLNVKILEDMFSSSNHKQFANNMLIKLIKDELLKHQLVIIPEEKIILNELLNVVKIMSL